VVAASGWNGETLWLMRACGEPCGWLGVDFNVDLMENYVARKYELVSRHEFYGATLREFRPLPPEGIPPAARADSE